MSTLHIYKSSAGSGKTYTLALNYLALLLKDEKAYRNILAVTFTNKAAAEMKGRILNNLFLLSSNSDKVKDLSNSLVEMTGLNLDQVQKKSVALLLQILNDYSLFRVETIDKFFQWIIRNFARETGLQAGYNLELNNNQVLSEALDLLMSSIGDDINLKNWLLRFAEEKIIEGKDWNFNRELHQLGSEIFSEKYQDITGGYKRAEAEKEKIPEYLKMLLKEIYQFENQMSSLGKTALKYISDYKLEISDFSYKEKGIAGYFFKIASKQDFDPKNRARNVLDGKEGWVAAKSENKNKIEELSEKYLNEILREAINYYDSNFIKYFTARTIFKNIYSFGVLTDIYIKIREITANKNIFLLSDATLFLKRLIGNNDAPFIFEKAGNNFNHFMLDEFQDTSAYQWSNFHPLILNGLSNNSDSLLVGDVKQSIYRWRNSYWEILASQAENSFPEFNKLITPLDINWRSDEIIVAFINTLFTLIGKKLCGRVKQECEEANAEMSFSQHWNEVIQGIYGNPVQKLPLNKQQERGYVEMSFFRDNSDLYLKRLTKILPELILDIQSRGYRPGDIAILVRKGTQGRTVSSILMQHAAMSGDSYSFNIISNDSLYIENHPGVRFIVSLLKYLRNPSDILNVAFIRHEYLRYLSTDKYQGDTHSIFRNCNEGLPTGIIDAFDNFISALEKIRHLPIYELVEELINVFQLQQNSGNIAFIQAFQDLVLSFVNEKSSDISAFLDWWEKYGNSQTLNVSETQDAIQIITVHKAKGLEFPVVILPFCDWNMDTEISGMNYLWCKNKDEPFNFIDYVPLKYQKELINTNYRQEYLNEKYHNYIDNINLLYVALTRPEKEMHVFANCPGKDAVSDFIYPLVSEKNIQIDKKEGYPYLNLNISTHEDFDKLTVGEKVNASSVNSVILPEFILDYPIHGNRNRLVLNTGAIWRETVEGDYSQKVGYGTVMHELFSRINTCQDIDPAINSILMSGKISENESVDLSKLLHEKLKRNVIKDWFDGSWEIMKEREICISKNRIIRPDRVMQKDNKIIVLDYKFGEEISDTYNKQLRYYIDSIKRMGYSEVKGYIWYFTLDDVREVL